LKKGRFPAKSCLTYRKCKIKYLPDSQVLAFTQEGITGRKRAPFYVQKILEFVKIQKEDENPPFPSSRTPGAIRGFHYHYINLKDKDWFRNRTEQQTLHSLPNGFEARSQHQPTQPAQNLFHYIIRSFGVPVEGRVVRS
jgi:hypothetical protein